MASKNDGIFDPKEVVIAHDVKVEAIEYLYHDRVMVGGLTLIAGKPGQGKSMFTAHLAGEVSKGGDAVIFSNMEDVDSVTRGRLEAVGADLKKVYLEHFRLPDELATLESEIRAKKAKLVIIDPIAAHLSVSIFNDQDVRKALSPLHKMAQRTKTAIVLVAHTVKHVSKSAHPQTAIGGSGGGLVGAARLIYFVGPNPQDNDERVLAAVKDSYRPLSKSMVFEIEDYDIEDEDTGKHLLTVGKLVMVNDNSDITAISVVATDHGAEANTKQPEKRANAAEWLTEYLFKHFAEDRKAYVKQLREDAAQAGLSWATIRRAKDDIGVYDSREGFGKGSKVSWNLPDDHFLIEEWNDMQEQRLKESVAKGGDEPDAGKVQAEMEADLRKLFAGNGLGDDDESEV